MKVGMLLGVGLVGRCIRRLGMGHTIMSNDDICVLIAGVILGKYE